MKNYTLKRNARNPPFFMIEEITRLLRFFYHMPQKARASIFVWIVNFYAKWKDAKTPIFFAKIDDSVNPQKSNSNFGGSYRIVVILTVLSVYCCIFGCSFCIIEILAVRTVLLHFCQFILYCCTFGSSYCIVALLMVHSELLHFWQFVL